jgi:hypothetical protein
MDLASQYSSLSTIGFQVEEAREVKGSKTRVPVFGGGILAWIESKEDHIAFVVSDNSVIPPRMEVRLLRGRPQGYRDK